MVLLRSQNDFPKVALNIKGPKRGCPSAESLLVPRPIAGQGPCGGWLLACKGTLGPKAGPRLKPPPLHSWFAADQ